VNPLKSFTKLAVVIEEFIIDFKEAGIGALARELTSAFMTATFGA
jgi:hypothetical protein